MLDVLLALLELFLGLLALHVLHGGDVIQIAHHLTTGSQTLGAVVENLQLLDLLFVVHVLFGHFDGIVTLTHGDGHEVLSQRLNLLAARESGFDPAIPDQVGDLVAEHRHPLVGRPTQLAIGHLWFLP